MSEYTCPKCGEEVGMMGHGSATPCLQSLSPKATELGRLRVELANAERRCPFCGVGAWRRSATAGRLECSSCGSIALDGRRTEAVKIKGEGNAP